MKALVVEDNDAIRRVIVGLLARRGHAVDAFRDAEAAWAAWEEGRHPLAVLDWGLPRMDGLALCRRMRSCDGGDRGAILILTGRSTPDDLDEVVAAGASDYLTKPFPLELLEVRVAFAERQAVALAARSEAQAELRRSERRFRALVLNAADVITLLDAAGIRTYVSPSVERVLGFPAEALVGTSLLEVPARSPDDRALAAELLADTLANPGRPVTTELRTPCRDGRERLFEVVATNLLADPAVGGIVLNARDISDRRQAEERLREAEMTYRTLVEQIPVTTYVRAIDEDRLVYVSQQTEQMLGYSVAERLVDAGLWRRTLHPEDAERVLAEVDQAVRTGAPFRSEYRQRRRDGEYVWVRDEAMLVRDATGVPIFWQGVVSDVTDRRLAEEALRESDRRHRELLAAAERQAAELRLLDRVRTALARELEPAVIFRTVVEEIAATFGYTLVSLYLVEGDELVLQHQVGYPRVLPRIPIGCGVMGRVARTGEAVWLADGRVDPDFLAAFDPVVSEVCVPLQDQGRVVGVLNLESVDQVELTAADLRLMTALAAHVETALSRARLYTAARESERKYRTVVDTVQEVIFQTDPRGRWSFLNPAWTEIMGYGVEESLGRSAYDFVHPDDREWLYREFRPLVQAGKGSAEAVIRGLTKAGEVRWLEARGRLTLGGEADGAKPVGIAGTLTDVTERKRAEEALRDSEERFRHLALHDPLTGLPNRSLFLDRLEHALAAAGRRATGLAVLFLDLDGFKLVNDSLGHDAGDRLLVSAGQRLATCIRPGDTVARLGGDEFAVLIEDLRGPDQAPAVAERLLAELRPPFSLDGQEVFIGASIGVAFTPAGAERPTDLIRKADIALYEAKGAGRGTYAVFEPRMSAPVVHRLRQQTDLRRAIDRGELRLHYQPAYDLATGAVDGLEALVRWEHPALGLLPPADFIRAAEATGLVVPLGEWALREACGRARRWLDEGVHGARVSVNLSARQVQEPNLIAQVEAALAEAGLPPHLLELEITESIVMADGAGTQRTLTGLRELGVRLALDDFGTGYSSLSYLRELPVDTLKIDRAFIAPLGQDRSSLAILRAIATLAHELGLTVTAEGVETVEQVAHLRGIGVDRGQGYYFTRPLDADAVGTLLPRNGQAPLAAGEPLVIVQRAVAPASV